MQRRLALCTPICFPERMKLLNTVTYEFADPIVTERLTLRLMTQTTWMMWLRTSAVTMSANTCCTARAAGKISLPASLSGASPLGCHRMTNIYCSRSNSMRLP